MATKRKAPEGSGANGKRKAVDQADTDGGDDLLDVLGDDGLLENENDEDAALQDALASDGLGVELGDELEGELGGQDGGDFGDELEGEGESTGEDEIDDEEQYDSEIAPSEAEENDEDVELPLPEATLTTAVEVEISETITAAQARRIAPLLCSNSELKTITYVSHKLTTEDLRENDGERAARCPAARRGGPDALNPAARVPTPARRRSPPLTDRRTRRARVGRRGLHRRRGHHHRRVPQGQQRADAPRPGAQLDCGRRRESARRRAAREHEARVPQPRVERRRREG